MSAGTDLISDSKVSKAETEAGPPPPLRKRRLSPVKQVDLIVNLDHGAQQPGWDLQLLQDVQDVRLLIHRLRMTDVSDVNQQILGSRMEREAF